MDAIVAAYNGDVQMIGAFIARVRHEGDKGVEIGVSGAPDGASPARTARSSTRKAADQSETGCRSSKRHPPARQN